MPAKKASGRSGLIANQIGGLRPSASVSFSLKEVNGTKHRFSGPSQRRQCNDLTLRTLVTPASVFFGLRLESTRYCGGVGMPHRAIASSRPAGVFRTMGAG